MACCRISSIRVRGRAASERSRIRRSSTSARLRASELDGSDSTAWRYSAAAPASWSCSSSFFARVMCADEASRMARSSWIFSSSAFGSSCDGFAVIGDRRIPVAPERRLIGLAPGAAAHAAADQHARQSHGADRGPAVHGLSHSSCHDHLIAHSNCPVANCRRSSDDAAILPRPAVTTRLVRQPPPFSGIVLRPVPSSHDISTDVGVTLCSLYLPSTI